MIGWVILLFIAGMLLVLAEFVVPGAVCGVLGGLLIIASTALGCYQYPDRIALVILFEFLGAVLTIFLGMLLLSRTKAGRFMTLAQSQVASSGWVASETDKSLNGKTGEVLTALRPAGTVMINGQRISAVSNGEFIDAEEKIRVIEVQGNRVVVERIS